MYIMNSIITEGKITGENCLIYYVLVLVVSCNRKKGIFHVKDYYFISISFFLSFILDHSHMVKLFAIIFAVARNAMK